MRGLRDRRRNAYRYQLIFKGGRLDFEEIIAKLRSHGFRAVRDENIYGQNHIKAWVGDWFLQFYGTGTVNAFVNDKKDASAVSEFLMQITGSRFEFDKVIPRPAFLWDIYEKTEEYRVCTYYPIICNIIEDIRFLLVKCLIDTFKLAVSISWIRPGNEGALS